MRRAGLLLAAMASAVAGPAGAWAQADGTPKWSFATQGLVFSSPAVAGDGTIYVGSEGNRLWAINPDGSFKWRVETGEAIQSSPALGPDGTVYFGSGDGRLYAVSPAGAVKWSFPTGDTVDSSPAVGPDGTVYFGSSDGRFYALKGDGTPAWNAPYDVGQGVFGGAAIRADGTIIFGASDRRIHALHADGTLKWTNATGDVVDSSATVTADGTILIGSYDNKLHALHGNGFPLADTSWPKFRRDLRNQAQASVAAEAESPAIVTPPSSTTVASGEAATFSVTASGTQPLAFQWLKDGEEIPGAQASSHFIALATLADEGTYSVRVSNAVGEVTSPAALLTVNPPLPPGLELQPRALTVAAGSRSSLWVLATGSEPLAYQWFKDGVPVAGATAAFYELESTQFADAGSYTVQVANAAETVTSDAAVVTVAASADAHLENLSTRGFAASGDGMLIPGFVVSGSISRRLLIRAVGPTLSAYGVQDFLTNPVLRLFEGETEILSNSAWGESPSPDALTAAAATVGAFELELGSTDAAMLVALMPGSYTAQASGADGESGQVLVEVYELP